PKYLGRYGEVYLFVAAIYFVCCYAMNGASLAGERLLSSINQNRLEIETHLSLGATGKQAIAGFTLYSAAYLAENVRGGLQSIPRGQREAAKALGLNSVYALWFIILPQALKTVIPSMVGQFIALFKDTSLLAIVGMTDLLGMSQSILANPKYLGRYGEVYLFVAAIYFVCCYAM
ncbi:MAG: ABC transporter permease, partial [Cyanobacteria bacterium J06598_4]